MVTAKLSRLFGVATINSQSAESIHQTLIQTLSKEERRLLLALIDEKDMERVYIQEENFRQGLKLGLCLGWEVFRCNDEQHSFHGD